MATLLSTFLKIFYFFQIKTRAIALVLKGGLFASGFVGDYDANWIGLESLFLLGGLETERINFRV